MSGVHVDPTALTGYAKRANDQSQALGKLAPTMKVDSGALGSFDEATDLAAALNHQVGEVGQRLSAASTALQQLANAALAAAGLAQQSDGDVATSMKQINRAIDGADAALAKTDPKPTTTTGTQAPGRRAV